MSINYPAGVEMHFVHHYYNEEFKILNQNVFIPFNNDDHFVIVVQSAFLTFQ